MFMTFQRLLAHQPHSIWKLLISLFSTHSEPNTKKSLIFSQTKKLTQLGRNGQVEKAKKLFDEMPHKNQVTYNAMISLLVNAGHLDSALQLFDEMPNKNTKSYTSMITGLSRSGLVSDATRLFDSIPFSQQNVFSCTAIISCYAQNGKPVRALRLFSSRYRNFFESKILPNAYTFSILLKCCCYLQSIESARQLQCMVVKLLDEQDKDSIFVQNSLIDVNTKLGHLAYAEGVIDRMKHKDLLKWKFLMDVYTHRPSPAN